MKKTAIFIVSLFLLFTAKAQQAHFGLKGGVNISQLHINDNTKIDSKVGVHLGVLAHIHASQNMGFTAGTYIFTGRCTTENWRFKSNLQFELP